MIINTSQGTVDLNQIKILYEQGVRKWLVSISGGCDSAIIGYIAAKMIKENNWQESVELYAMTGDSESKPYNIKFAKKIIKKIEELTDVKFVKHFAREIKNDSEENYENYQLKLAYDSHKEVGWGLFWHGITQNPIADPSDPQAMHLVNTIETHGPVDDRNAKDEAVDIFQTEIFDEFTQDFLNDEKHLHRVHPLRNLDKKGVADLYKHFGVMDSLFPVTRSCEHPDPTRTNNFTIHCETDCWWCWERLWGFGRII